MQERRVIPDSELFKFFEEAKKRSERVNWYGYFVTLYMTCSRVSEITSLKKSQIKNGIIQFHKTKAKPKAVFIHPQLRPILEEAIKRSKVELVFPNINGEEINRRKIRDRMIELCRLVGIPKATPHDLRHTFASRIDIESYVKQKIGGWVNKRVLEDTYNHPAEDIVRQAYFGVDLMPKSE